MSTSGSWGGSSSFSGAGAPVVGQLFAQFKIIGLMGAGGMGAVFRAQDQGSGQEVALKVLRSKGTDGDLQIRFQREGEALGQLNHKNIVKVGTVGVHEGYMYFSMELLEGESLKELLRSSYHDDGSPNLVEVVRIFKSLALALVFCHAEGVVHRDLKPENIIIEEETGRPVLIDFGLVRWIAGSQDGHDLTQSQDVLGTPHYMSPEQLGIFPEKVAITSKTDVWSFGVTLFNALTGKTPFHGETIYNLFTAMVNSEPARSRDYQPDLPTWLDDLCESCLQKNPRARPNMQEIYESLVAGEEQSLAREQANWGRHLLVLGACLLPVILYFALGVREPPSIVVRQKGPLFIKTPTVHIQGRALPIGARVTVNGRKRWRSENNGLFDMDIDLKPGERSVFIEVKSGSLKKSTEVRVILDQTAPEIRIQGMMSKGLVLLKSERLNGQVLDENLIPKVTISGDEYSLDKDGRFSVAVGSPDRVRDIYIGAEDRAGNGTHLKLKVLAASAFRSRQKRILHSRNLWNETDPGMMDIIILKIAKKLGSKFEFIETRSYRCGGQQHRLASFRHRRSGVVFQLLPGGSFQMGRKREDSPHEKRKASNNVFRDAWDWAMLTTPVHKVRIPPFLMARFELTRAQWFNIQGPKRPRPNGDLPMTGVNWNEIQEWLKKAGDGLRLPSESEWEYGCRAGTTTRYPWGQKHDVRYAWLSDPAKKLTRTQEVTKHKDLSNAFGLVDVLGNVWEWCQDDFEVNYKGHSHDHKSLQSRAGLNNKVIRSFSYLTEWRFAQSAERMRAHPSKSFHDLGFRLALSLPR
jgi:serine/threonine protein kinase/formylglycine-generating enzyme required for sulfatase activity